MKFCPNCGTKVSSDSVFCPNCGHKFDSTANQSNQVSRNPSNNYYNQNNYYGYSNQKIPVTPPPCGMGQAFELFWDNYVNFSGLSSRSEYWFMILWEFLIGMVLFMLCFVLIGIPLMILWGIAIFIPNLSLIARRMRDAGIPDGWIIALLILDFVPFIDFIPGIATFIIMLMPSVRRSQ